MMAQRRSPWPALLLLVATAAAIYGATNLRERAGAPTSRPLPAVQPGRLDDRAARESVCVTRLGLCRAPVARAGDPCRCPHPLRGMVSGHVERLGQPPARPGSGDWADTEPADELYDWEGFVGP